MRVFLTGGTGYTGAHIALELLERGDEVTILARNPSKAGAFLKTPGISVVVGDVQDIDFLHASLPGHDACIHHAIVWDEEPTELELQDTRASAALFDAAGKAGIRQLIYTSSTAVHRPFTMNMNEEARLHPADAYGATKMAGEAFLSACSFSCPMRCNVVRSGPVIGPPAYAGGHVNTHSKFQEIVDLARAGDDIRVARGDGRQFVSATDLVIVYGSLLRSEANRQTYLAVSRNFTTWENIAGLIVGETGSNSRVVVEDGAEDSHNFDVGKIEREFGLSFDSRAAMLEHVRAMVARR